MVCADGLRVARSVKKSANQLGIAADDGTGVERGRRCRRASLLGRPRRGSGRRRPCRDHWWWWWWCRRRGRLPHLECDRQTMHNLAYASFFRRWDPVTVWIRPPLDDSGVRERATPAGTDEPRLLRRGLTALTAPGDPVASNYWRAMEM